MLKRLCGWLLRSMSDQQVAEVFAKSRAGLDWQPLADSAGKLLKAARHGTPMVILSAPPSQPPPSYSPPESSDTKPAPPEHMPPVHRQTS